MNKLDLRQVGKIMGLPVYVDFASIPETNKTFNNPLSARDEKEVQVGAIMMRAFNPPLTEAPCRFCGEYGIHDCPEGRRRTTA